VKAVLVRSAVLSAALTFALSPFAFAVNAANQTAVDNGGAYLAGLQAADGHIGNAPAGDTDWSAVALAAAGRDLGTVQTAGGTSLRAYLAGHVPGASATPNDWARGIIAITADGQNPYDFGGTNYVAKLKSFATGHQLGSATDTNDDFFGLIALAAARVPNTDPVLADEVAAVLSYQHADGGFTYTTGPATGSDVDDTAAAITALRAAQASGAGTAAVATALAAAQSYVMPLQHADGGFPFNPAFGPDSNVSSSAWTLIALNALGLGDATAGAAAQGYLSSQQLPDGSFPSSFTPGVGDIFDTTPAVTALAGATWPAKIYAGALPVVQDPTPSPSPSPSVSPSPTPSATPSPAPAGIVLGASATPTPTPTTGSVLGASTLPAVGEVANLTLLLIAFAFASTAGLAVYLRQRRR